MLRTFLLIPVLATAHGLKKLTCANDTIIDISNGTHLHNGDINYKGEIYSKQEYYTNVDTGRQKVCICNKLKCVRKCCGLGYGYNYKKKTCEPTSDLFNPPIWNKSSVIEGDASTMFHFIYGKMNCTLPAVRIRIGELATSIIRLQENGSLLVKHPNRLEDVNSYCIDTFYSGNNTGHFDALLCYQVEPPVNAALLLLRQICMSVSCVFFLATLAVYAWLPELRNLHGKVLMAYLVCMLLGFICMECIQNLEIDMSNCAIMTLVTCFWLHSAFFWLNVMSFDIWWTFSGKRGLSLERLSSRARFLAYCLYAFGLPFLLVSITAGLEYANLGESKFLPMMRQKFCFLYGIHKFIYLYVPMLIICGANMVFFIMTAIKIARIKQQTSVLNSKDSSTTDINSKDRQRLSLYLKLFAVMGINWILEVVSSFFPQLEYVFIVTDVYNVLTGVIIFVIFVCKRKIIRLMKKRYAQMRGEPTSSNTTATQLSTRTHSSRDDVRMTSIKNHIY